MGLLPPLPPVEEGWGEGDDGDSHNLRTRREAPPEHSGSASFMPCILPVRYRQLEAGVDCLRLLQVLD